MTNKKPLSEKPRKKKVIKKKRNRLQRFIREKRKAQEQKKTEKQGNRWKSLIPVILLAVLVAAGVIAFAVLKYQESVRRQEAMKLMQEARESRKQKEKTQQERYLATVRERMKVADQVQEAWEDLWLEEIELTAENQDTFATIESCLISSEDTSIVEIKGILPGIPKSDSDDIYIFPLNTYETSIPEGAEPAAHLWR